MERKHNGQKKKDKRRDNTMGKIKRTKGETTQRSKEKGQKERQHNGQKKKDKRVSPFVLFILPIVLSLLLSFLFCPLCCLSFCPFSFDHCVVSPFVLFLLTIVLSLLLSFSFDKRRDNTMGKIKRTKGETTQ
jgi:H+/gluconate symporter-like permease